MKIGYPILGSTLVFCIWSLLTYSRVFSPILLPAPSKVAARFWEIAASGEMTMDISSTLYRWAIGFASGSIVGIPVGLLMGHYVLLRRTFAIVIDAARSVPVVAMIPIFLIFFGVGSMAKIALAAWASALVVLINSMYGASRTKELWLLTAQTLGATPNQVFLKVVVPGALPDIMVGLRLAISHALVVVIASEMLLGGDQYGLGRKLSDAAMLFRTTDAYAIIFIIGVVGYAANSVVIYAEQYFTPWANK